MLEALARSLAAQRQLVADASHELRTPLTSVRTNIEVLARSERAAPAEREQLLADVVGQLEELTAIVADVVELARGGEPDESTEELRLDELVEDAVERARRLARPGRLETDLEPRSSAGRPTARACGRQPARQRGKWSPPGGPVEVAVRGGEVLVRDHGPGIDGRRRCRACSTASIARPRARLPGSGLGLAIVRQVAEAHGGHGVAENAPDGGAGCGSCLPRRAELLGTS